MKKTVSPIWRALCFQLLFTSGACTAKPERQCDQTGWWGVNRTSTNLPTVDKQIDLFGIVKNEGANSYSIADFFDPGSISIGKASYFQGCHLHLVINGDADGQDYSITRDYQLSGSAGTVVTGKAETVIGDETIDWTAEGFLFHIKVTQ